MQSAWLRLDVLAPPDVGTFPLRTVTCKRGQDGTALRKNAEKREQPLPGPCAFRAAQGPPVEVAAVNWDDKVTSPVQRESGFFGSFLCHLLEVDHFGSLGLVRYDRGARLAVQALSFAMLVTSPRRRTSSRRERQCRSESEVMGFLWGCFPKPALVEHVYAPAHAVYPKAPEDQESYGC